MKVTDDRKITVEIDGTKHKLTLAEAQELYSELGKVAGLVQPYRQYFGGGFLSSSTPTMTAQGGYVNSGRVSIVGEGADPAVIAAQDWDPNRDEDDPPLAAAV